MKASPTWPPAGVVATAALAVAIIVAVAGATFAAAERERAPSLSCRSRGPSDEAKLDLSTDRGTAAPFLKRFDRRAMHFALGPDSIRSIDSPCFESPAAAGTLLHENALVIGVERNGDARAYPIDLLSYHEVVNDSVGGVPIAVTWCPLCASAVVYERTVEGRVLEFGVSGFLYRANLMLFDRKTGSLWSQLLGGAVTGPMRGSRLREAPFVQQTWAAWREDHPQTKALTIRGDELGVRFTQPETRGFDDTDAPYGTYFSKVPIYFPNSHRGVPDASLVLGVVVRGRSKAYAAPALRRRRAFNDVVAGEPLLLTADDGSLSVNAFSRRVGARTLTFRAVRGSLLDRGTRSRWSARTGRAVAGPLAGVRLERVPSTPAYWFAWRNFHPATAVWNGD
jgi:Protein of unknown function (DUF3179)